MKVYLDDLREAPQGWVRCLWPNEVIELLYTGEVTDINLDHDLGNDEQGTGYDVLLWIEEAVAERGWTPPRLNVHSANVSGRMKMEAAIRSISRLVSLQNDYTKHHEKNDFLTFWDGSKPAWYAPPSGEPIKLRDSSQAYNFFEVGDDMVLGAEYCWQCYRQEFRDNGWQRPLARQQIALWNKSTGERLGFLTGHHYSDVHGAEILDDERLLTWGHDYLIRVWDYATGRCLDTLPLPIWPDPAKRQAVLSCQAFSQIKSSQKKRYVDERHLPAPDVRIDWIVMPGGLQYNYECLAGTDKVQNIVKPWLPGAGLETEHGAQRIENLHGAEAGYSTWHIMADGRLLGGGTTYGTSGDFYVWDGYLSLQILKIGRSHCNVNLVGEVSPNVVAIEDYTGLEKAERYTFDLTKSVKA